MSLDSQVFEISSLICTSLIALPLVVYYCSVAYHANRDNLTENKKPSVSLSSRE